MFFNKYLQQTKSPIYSFIYILPLFIIYEIGIWLISSDDLPTVRNGADVLIRSFIAQIGISGIYGMGLVLFIGMLISYIIYKGKIRRVELKSSYFIIMIVESVLWGLLLSFTLSHTRFFLSAGNSNLVFQQVVLSIGSGLFEEFLFRVILVGIIALIVGFFIRKNYWYKMSIAIIIGAVIFSYFHFIGEQSNTFEIGIFLYRSLAGLLLGYLYVLRGFGIVAYAHSFYNLFILSQVSVA